MDTPHPFHRYTAEMLAWRLGRPVPAEPLPRPAPEVTARRAARVVRAASGRSQVILVGAGTGDLAAALASDLPESTSLTVLGGDPEAVRPLFAQGPPAWLAPGGNRQLLADGSAMALLYLTLGHGLDPASALVTANPEGQAASEPGVLETWRRLFAGVRPAPSPDPGEPPRPRPTLALLARADEPGLEDFFRAVAGLAERAVIVWDAQEVPPRARLAEALCLPVRHLARRLDGDFAAQRNALLAACPPGPVLCLDPDERPGPGFREVCDRLGALPDLGGAYFPRLTLHPAGNKVLVGHGLWPDVQLRYFRQDGSGRARYVRPLHERLEGLSGRAALVLDAPILHGNRLVAGPEAVAAKLAAYSALAGAARHRLSADYPALPREFFAPPAGLPPGGRVLLSPPLW